jgi:uncharacterized membrane protein
MTATRSCCCSAYDKKVTLPGKQKQAVNATSMASDNIEHCFGDKPNAFLHVDTHISDLVANVTDINQICSHSTNGRPK